MSIGMRPSYDPDEITAIHVHLLNDTDFESIELDPDLVVPLAPATVSVTDAELCTVGRSGAAPDTATIEFEMFDGAGSYTLLDGLPLTVAGCD